MLVRGVGVAPLALRANQKPFPDVERLQAWEYERGLCARYRSPSSLRA